MTTVDQQKRTLILTTALGENKLAVRRLTAIEGLSELFDFRIDAVSEEADLDFGGALGQSVSLKMTGFGERFFNGVLAEARWIGATEDLHSYQLSVKPWLWLLTCAADCRVFSSQAVPEIIQQVFKDRGFSDVRPELTGSYPQLEYCVQYRESDFAFVSRLMEQNGIYYYFEHTPDQKHTLVLADGPSSHHPILGLQSLPYNPATVGGGDLQEQIEAWRRGRLVRSGRYVLNDYNYRKPNENFCQTGTHPDITRTTRWKCSTIRASISNRRRAAAWRQSGSRRRSRSTSAARQREARIGCFPAPSSLSRTTRNRTRTRNTCWSVAPIPSMRRPTDRRTRSMLGAPISAATS